MKPTWLRSALEHERSRRITRREATVAWTFPIVFVTIGTIAQFAVTYVYIQFLGISAPWLVPQLSLAELVSWQPSGLHGPAFAMRSG